MLDARKPPLTLVVPPPTGSAAASARPADDGALIVRLAAQRLHELGLHGRAEALRLHTEELEPRALALFRVARADEPGASRDVLLRAAAKAIAHRWAQRFN